MDKLAIEQAEHESKLHYAQMPDSHYGDVLKQLADTMRENERLMQALVLVNIQIRHRSELSFDVVNAITTDAIQRNKEPTDVG